MSFSVDGIAVGTAVTNSYGIASLTYWIPAGMTLGGHTITANFAGTTYYNASTGAGTLQVKANTTVTAASVTGQRGRGHTERHSAARHGWAAAVGRHAHVQG